MSLLRYGLPLSALALLAAACVHDATPRATNTGSSTYQTLGSGSGSVSDATGATGPGISSGASRGIGAGTNLSGTTSPTQSTSTAPNKKARVYEANKTPNTGKIPAAESSGDRNPTNSGMTSPPGIGAPGTGAAGTTTDY